MCFSEKHSIKCWCVGPATWASICFHWSGDWLWVRFKSSSVALKYSQGSDHCPIFADLQTLHVLFPVPKQTFPLLSSHRLIPVHLPPGSLSGLLQVDLATFLHWRPRLHWACFHENSIILYYDFWFTRTLSITRSWISFRNRFYLFFLYPWNQAGCGTLQDLSKYLMNKLIRTRPSDLLWVTF